MTRETCRAADLAEDNCVFLNYHRGEQVRVVKSAYTVKGNTTVVFNDGEALRVGSDVPFNLATQQEVEEADAEADRKAFAAALDRFADRVVQARLPVPHRDKRIHLGLDLDRVEDVQAWSRWLASNPQQGTSRLVVLAEVEGVEVMVRGPEGSTAEFGPDVADAAQERPDVFEQNMAILRDHSLCAPDVEHRDSVVAFPIASPAPWCAHIACPNFTGNPHPRTESCPPDAKPKPAPDGWPISDGHRPPVDDEAMKHDRHSGEG